MCYAEERTHLIRTIFAQTSCRPNVRTPLKAVSATSAKLVQVSNNDIITVKFPSLTHRPATVCRTGQARLRASSNKQNGSSASDSLEDGDSFAVGEL